MKPNKDNFSQVGTGPLNIEIFRFGKNTNCNQIKSVNLLESELVGFTFLTKRKKVQFFSRYLFGIHCNEFLNSNMLLAHELAVFYFILFNFSQTVSSIQFYH